MKSRTVVRLAQPGKTRLVLMHVVDSPITRIYGEVTADRETGADRRYLDDVVHAQLGKIVGSCGCTVVLGRIALDPTMTLDEFIDVMQSYGEFEVTRSGRVAMSLEAQKLRVSPPVPTRNKPEKLEQKNGVING